MSDERTQMHVTKGVRELVRSLMLPGETYDDTVKRLIHERGSSVSIQIPVELYEFLKGIAYGVSDEGGIGIVDVSSTVSEWFSKGGAVLGFRGSGFTDWGVQETAKARMITFYGIDDPYLRLSRTLKDVMEVLIDDHGVHELEALYEEAVEILAAHYVENKGETP